MVVKRAQQSQDYLNKGSKVEVSSNEDGYRGAWFSAMIIEPDPSNSTPAKKKRKGLSPSHKALIQYDTLISDDDITKPLTELVDVASIRPRPPADNAGRHFLIGDVVDAFHLDAWWTGVVMEVAGGFYTVGFKAPPDVLKLERADLRLHWELEDGVWIQAPREIIMGSIFKPGTEVELNLNKEELYYSWVSAIYLGQVGINSFLLQYKSSNNCDVKVVVCPHQVRPQPPNSGERDFSLLERVDAFHDMGWWVGEITKVLTGKKYMVKFKFTKQEKECSHSELRPHMEWTDRKWVSKKFSEKGSYFEQVQSSEDYEVRSKKLCESFRNFEKLQSSSDYAVRSKHACKSFRNYEVATPLGSSGGTKDNTDEKTPCSRISWKNQMKHLSPCIDRSPYGKTKKKLKMSQQPDDDPTILSLSKKLKGGDSEYSLSFAQSRRTPDKEAPVRDSVKTGQQQVEKLDNQGTVSCERKHNPRESQCDMPWPVVRHERKGRQLKSHGKKGSEIEKADEEHAEDEHVMENMESSGIRSSSEVTGGSHAGTSCLHPMEEVERQNQDGVSSEIKRKGKLPALLVEYSKEPVTDCMNGILELPVTAKLDLTGEKHNVTGVVAQVALTETQVIKDKGSGDARVEEETVISEMDIDKVIEKIIDSSSDPAGTATHQNEVNGRQVETCVTGSQDAVTEVKTVDFVVDYSTKEVEVAVDGKPVKTTAHDQPFASNHAGTVNQQSEVRGTQVETGVTGNIEHQDSPHLPFVKSSAIWEKIESMDVFKKYPQKPHFHPLLKFRETRREGLAIGNMVTFASLVEKISKLQVSDPRDLFDSSMEELVELEMLGFDVKAVQHRLNSLLEMKVKLGQLQDQSKAVEIHIMERTHDRANDKEMMSEIDKEIKDLQERRQMLMSMDVVKGSEISRLQTEANLITSGIQTIYCDFEKLAAATM